MKQFTLVTILLISIFLLQGCIESMTKKNVPNTEANRYEKYQQEQKEYEVAKKEYESAKKEYESAKTNYNSNQSSASNNQDIEVTSSARLKEKQQQNNTQSRYVESSLLLSIYAKSKVNLDSYQRANPISVHVFQLDEADTFDQLDYYTLLETADPRKIDRTFISKEVMDFFPDEKRKIFLQLNKETHYLGIFATYSDTSNTRWKAIVPLKSTRNLLTITLGEDGIQVVQ
jgi:type VI secretion system protein VasD